MEGKDAGYHTITQSLSKGKAAAVIEHPHLHNAVLVFNVNKLANQHYHVWLLLSFYQSIHDLQLFLHTSMESCKRLPPLPDAQSVSALRAASTAAWSREEKSFLSLPLWRGGREGGREGGRGGRERREGEEGGREEEREGGMEGDM